MRIASLSAGLLALAAYAGGACSQERPYYFRLDTGNSWAQGGGFHDRTFTGGALGFLVCGNPPCTSNMSINHLGQSPVYGVGAGWRFNPQWRADLTLGWRKFKVDGIDQFPENVHGDVNSQVAMLTGYWDIPVDGKLKPYVGAGVGMARNSMGITTDSFIPGPGTILATPGVKTSTAMSLAAGVSYAICEGVAIEVGYRYLDLGKFQTGNVADFGFGITIPYQGAEGKLRTNELTLGVRF